MKKYLLSALTLLSFSISKAQFNDKIVSDRPSLSNSPKTVGQGVLQFQHGFTYKDHKVFDDKNFFRYFNYDNRIRIGIAEKIDFATDINLNTVRYENKLFPSANYANTSLNYLAPWFRFALLSENKILPNIGIHAGTYFYNNFFKNNSRAITGSIQGIISKKILSKTSLKFFFEKYFNRFDFSDKAYFYTFCLTQTINEKENLFFHIENFGNKFLQNNWDMGLAWLVSDNIQLDVFGGMNFTGGKFNYYFVSTGLSWRITAFHD